MSGWKGLLRPEAGDHIEAWEVGDLLASLTEKSLAVTDRAGRWRLLETVRDYGRGQLSDSDEAAVMRDRHRDCFLALAEEAEPHLHGADQHSWLERLEIEHDNLRAALEWCSSEGDVQGEGQDFESGLRLAGALWLFWAVRGYFGEGRGWLSGLLRSNELSVQGGITASTARANALNGAGALAFRQGDYLQSRALFEESLSIRRQMCDQRGVAGSLSNLGLVAFDQSDYLAAGAYIEESLAIRRTLDDRSGIATSLNNLGMVAFGLGDYSAAWTLYEESLAIKRELGDHAGIASSMINLAQVAYAKGEYPAARALCVESLKIFHELGYRWGFANALEELAPAMSALGCPDRAARVWGFAERLREQIHAPFPPKERPRYERQVSAVRSALGADDVFEIAWQEGRDMTLQQAMDVALLDDP